MATIKYTKFDNPYIEGEITIRFSGYMTQAEADKLTDEQAAEILEKAKGFLADGPGANDAIANAEIKVL